MNARILNIYRNYDSEVPLKPAFLRLIVNIALNTLDEDLVGWSLKGKKQSSPWPSEGRLFTPFFKKKTH